MSASMIPIVHDHALTGLRDAQELGAPDIVSETISPSSSRTGRSGST